MKTTEYCVRIKDLPQNERPLERLYKYGPDVLRPSELIAIIISDRDRAGNSNSAWGAITSKV